MEMEYNNHQGENDIVEMKGDIRYIRRDVDSMLRRMEAEYLTRQEFEPVKRIVYGLVGLILVGVVGALLGLVLIN